MKAHSDAASEREDLRAKIIGLGEKSVRKSYYPELEQRLTELERFKTLLDESSDLVFLLRIPSGQVVDVNESVSRRYALSRDKLLTTSISDLVSESVWEQLASLFADESQVGQVGKTIDTTLKPNGSDMPVEMSVRLVALSDAVYGVIVARDITKRKQAEEALRNSEAKYRLIVETAYEGIWVVDAEGVTTFVNARMAEMLGYSTKEMLERTMTDFMFEEDAPDHLEKMENRRRGISEIYQRKFRRDDGEIVWTFVSASPIFDVNRRFTGSFAMLTDITEQHRTADEVIESRKQVLDILESITDAFYALDNDWRFTYVNRKAEEMIGVNRLNLLFRNIWQILHKEDSPKIFEEYTKAKEEMKPVVFEEFISRSNRWIEMHVYPYPNGLSVYLRDVTKRKQAEQERLADLRFFESMERINKAMSGTSDLEQMMRDTLNEAALIFDCDRAYFLYPLAPESPYWSIPMEVAKPGLESPIEARTRVSTEPDDIIRFKRLLEAKGPLRFGPGSDYPLPTEFRQRFRIGSVMAMALYPKLGKPWMFGVLQSSYDRVWTDEEARLFREIGRRIADGLTSLLIYRELKENEQKYHDLFDKSLDGIFVSSSDDKLLDVNQKVVEMLGYDTKEEVLKLDIAHDIYANPADLERDREMVNKNGSSEFNIIVKKKSDEQIVVHLSLAVVRDMSGNITSYMGLVHNIMG
jgi:PAS domain S-box-containing protein